MQGIKVDDIKYNITYKDKNKVVLIITIHIINNRLNNESRISKIIHQKSIVHSS